MIRRVAWILGGCVWGVVAFGVGAWAAFPEEAVKDRMVYEVGKGSKDEYALDVEDLSLWRLSGLDARDVKLYTVKKPRKGPKKKKPAEEPEATDAPESALERSLALSLDRLAVRAAVIPTLMGERAVAFVAETLDGSIDGTWAQSKGGVKLAFDADDLDLSLVPPGKEGTQLSFLGKLQAHADLELDSDDPKKSKGTLRFDLPGFGLAKGSKLGGFELPEVVFDKAVLAMEADNGKLEVTEGTFESSTLTATVSGNVTLNKKLARSRLRLEIVFSLPDDLDKLAQLAPDLRRARDAEGQYHYLVTGTVLDPSARATRAGAKGKGPGARDKGDDDGMPGLLDRPFAGAGGGDASDEDRKAAREKRLEERRERLRKRREDAEKNGAPGMDRPFPPRDDGDLPDDFVPPGFEDGPPPPQEFPPDDGPMFPPPDGGNED